MLPTKQATVTLGIRCPSNVLISRLQFDLPMPHHNASSLSQQAQLEALRESEARMRSLLDSAAEGIWGLDLEGRCTFVNSACLRLLGYERAEELLGQNMHALTHRIFADGRPYPQNACRIAEALREGDITEVEDEVFLRKDGSPFAVHYRSSAIVRDGRVLGAVVTFRDVTERRRAEDERAKTLTLLHTLANNAAEALYLMDSQGGTTFMNPAAERMFGWSSEETLGKRLHDLIHHKRLDGSAFPIQECSLGRVLITGEALLDHEDEFLHKDGHFVPVSCSNAPVITDGQITGAVLVVHDLTERKRAATDATHRAEFEQQLIGIVSHDLRNPITAILMSAQALMRREDIDPLILKSLARIASSGERASRLIRDLLDFTQARLGAGIPIQRCPLDLHELIRQVVEEVQQAHPHRDLLFEASGDGRGEWDPDRLHQIATNLAVNALAYSPSESVVRVRTWAEDSLVMLEVHNTGKPIPEGMLPMLFGPFRRGQEMKHSPAGNIGLGLFIVDQLVRAHGGTIDVSSTEDEGTTFRVRLPRAAR
jgi:PAS domain S-box-containing protein